MEIDRNTLLIIGALGIGAFYFMSTPKGSGYKYYVPGQGYVDESMLPSMGYQKVNGMWYSPSQMSTATSQAGYPPGTPVNETMQIFNDIMAILATLIPLAINTVNIVVNNQNRNQVIQAVIQKYATYTSPDYIATFPYTTPGSMSGLTNEQLQKLLNTGQIAGISGFKSKKKGNTYYVDTEFVQASNKGGKLSHMGFGDFVVEVKGGGEISFIRVNEKFPGFSGRTHKVLGSESDFKKLRKLMAPTSKEMKQKKYTSSECSNFGSKTSGGKNAKVRSWGASGLAHCKWETKPKDDLPF